MQKLNKNILIGLGVSLFVLLLLGYGYLRLEPKLIDYNYYEALLDGKMINKARIDGGYLVLQAGEETYKIAKDVIDLKAAARSFPLEISSEGELASLSSMVDIVALVVLLFFLVVLVRSAKREQVNVKKEQSEAQEKAQKEQNKNQHAYGMSGYDDFSAKILPQVSSITFKDVAGIKEVREELEEIIDFLKNPKKYRDFGVSLPKGVLLIGPPGVGKTLIAKAVAGEANVPFFYQSGSSFVQMYVGVGAKRVRDLFTRAKAMSPSIIFIDEIDAVGKARGGFRNDEREATLNQLLTEMDGFEERGGVIVIGATNKIEMLDDALLRSGRFDRRVFVGLPDLEERLNIFSVYLKNKPCSADIESLARMSVGFSGAAIASFVNESALHAIKRGSSEIVMDDFLSVKDKVILGKKKLVSFSDKEKRILATYQAGKAITAYWFEVEFEKISLVSDSFQDVDKEIVSRSEIVSKIKVFLSGVAATDVMYKESFSHGAEDLARAKILASEMVERYGMGSKMVGDIMDVNTILSDSYSDMKEFLVGMMPALARVEALLLQKESISKEELRLELAEVL